MHPTDLPLPVLAFNPPDIMSICHNKYNITVIYHLQAIYLYVDS